jgi:CHAD domain-containing protein
VHRASCTCARVHAVTSMPRLPEIPERGILALWPKLPLKTISLAMTGRGWARKAIVLEVEAKFGIPDEQTFQQLLDADTLAGFRLGATTVAELHDCYQDTASAALRANGYAYRLRRRGNRYTATLKGLGATSGAVHRREEYEVELAAPLVPQHWPPSPARKLALELCETRPLIPMFKLTQIRYSRPIHHAQRAVAELSLDRVSVHRAGEIASYLELEAELLPRGTKQELEQIAAELQGEWELRPESRSKFERALAHLGPGLSSPQGVEGCKEQGVQPVVLLEAPGIEADDPMSEAGRKTFRFHYLLMVYNEPGTRLGEDIEALHDMRVATRRMRAAFRIFGRFFKPKAIAPYRKGLKRTGRALGRVRDLDVFRAKIHAFLTTLPESQQDSLDSLLAALQAQRQADRERMLAHFDSPKYVQFKARFGEFVETEGMGSLPSNPDGGEPRPHRVRHVAPLVVYERLAAVRAYDEWVSIPNPALKRLHALRIACKRLRYTLEFFREVLGPDTSSLIEEIVTVQDHLGDLQDAVVANDILQDYLGWGTWGHSPAQPRPAPPAHLSDPGVEAYLVAKRAELQQLLDTFPPAWRQIKGVEFSQKVAQAVSVL